MLARNKVPILGYVISNIIEFMNRSKTFRNYHRNQQFISLCHSSTAGSTISYLAYAGLGNRLRSHYLASRIGQLTGRKIGIVWMGNPHLMSDGSDLFTEQHSHLHTELRRCRYALLSMRDIRSGEYRRIAAEQQNRLLVLGTEAQWTPFQEAARLTPEASTVYLDIRNAVHEVADAIIAGLPRPYIGVHIRQTDFVTPIGNAQSLRYFEQQIVNAASVTSYRTLVIASDDIVYLSKAVESRFEKVVTIRPTLRRDQIGVASEAMSHILVLMQADEFIPSPYSSFSEFVIAEHNGLIKIR